MNIKWLTASIISVVLTGCGGSSSSDPAPAPDLSPPSSTPVNNAVLTVSLDGLPDGTDGNVSVSGPEGFLTSISTSTTLNDLASGDYTVTVSNVTVEGVIFDVIPAEQTVTLSQNDSESLSLTYQAPITSTGNISNFGSVIVNGIRFNTDNAIVDGDDSDTADENDLSLGMVVKIQGRATADGDIAEAQSVTVEITAQGPVEAISLASSTFTVLGQTFKVDELTLFEGVTFETLAIGDIVEINALESNDGDSLATRVELEEENSGEFTLRGEIQSLDEVTQTFEINALTVDYSVAIIDGVLADNAEVRVTASTPPEDNSLLADSVEVQSDNDEEEVSQVALDGVITDVSDDMTFIIAGEQVAWNNDTRFIGGTEDEITVDLRVKVFGLENDSGIIARQIRIDKPGIIQLEGPISDIDMDALSINVLDTVFFVDDYTNFIDQSSLRIRRLTLDDLSVGDTLALKAFQDDGMLLTRILKRVEAVGEDDNDNEASLEGRVSDINAPFITIQGTTVSTSAITEFEYDNAETDADNFFAQLQEGNRIEIDARIQPDGSILALEVEAESNGNNGEGNGNGSVDVSGEISEIVSESEFILNNRSVLITSQTRFKDGSERSLVVGALVEVRGREAQNGNIVARRIEFINDEQRDDVELSGAISNFVSAAEFTVADTQVSTTSDTHFENGSDGDLADGVSVDVEGYLTDDGIVIAEEIEFDDDASSLTITGTITQFDSAEAFVVNEQPVITTEDTEFENGNRLSLEEGIEVTVEGTLNADNVLVADKIELPEAEEVELEGEISNVNSDSEFTVDETSVFITDTTIFRNGDSSQIEVGVFVEIEGIETESGLEALVITFEDLDDDNEEEVTIEGDIEAFNSVTDFIVDGQAISTNADTLYENGTVDDLTQGVSVEIEGAINNDNILIATLISFE